MYSTKYNNHLILLFLAEISKERTYLWALMVKSNLLTLAWLSMYAVFTF
jgi:hypothetical protein